MAYHGGSEPTDVRLKIHSESGRDYAIKLNLFEPETFQLSDDGTAEFHLPSIRKGCSVYWFGFIKTRDGSPYKFKVVELIEGEKVRKQLSIADLKTLPVDDSGFSLVEVR